eukprot:TRINITY_DN452_c0_g3_i1.p1 TRINITY_DN452_c0_g3~~TRINITY_DN452_c0_g3_i1.p1  ORF type:complete len:4920 (+),score=1199.75 TRINITY_DN452_c0_g3_i1:6726-21485(+)
MGPDQQGGHEWTILWSFFDSQKVRNVTVDTTELVTEADKLYVDQEFNSDGSPKCVDGSYFVLDETDLLELRGWCQWDAFAAVETELLLCNVTVSPNVLMFDRDQWYIPQVVTVTPTDDYFDEPEGHLSVIGHVASSDDYVYDNILIANVTAHIADDDISGVLISHTSLTVMEDGLATYAEYTISLTSEPLYDVYIYVHTFLNDLETPCYRMNLCNTTVEPEQFVYEPNTWTIPQIVKVWAIDDNLDEYDLHSSLLVHTARSLDPLYNRVKIPSIDVNIRDNDSAGLILNKNIVSVTEEGISDGYNITLTCEPYGDVVVMAETSELPGRKVVVSPLELTFTPDNWYLPQTITVSAFEDKYVEDVQHNGFVTHMVVSGDLNYHEMEKKQVEPLGKVDVVIEDNDLAAIMILDPIVLVAEGGDAKEDCVAATHLCSSAKYRVMLGSRPWEDVVVYPEVTTGCFDISANLCNITTSPDSLTFSTDNYNIPQFVTVTAVDDLLDEGDHEAYVSHRSTSIDTPYSNLVGPDTLVNIKDNDLAGVTVTVPVEGVQVSEGGFSSSYELVLNSQPLCDVKVILDAKWGNMTNDFTGEQKIFPQLIFDGPDSLSYDPWAVKPVEGDEDNVTGVLKPYYLMRNHTIFTRDNWNVSQTIDVIANDDNMPEGGMHDVTIVHILESCDASYAGTKLLATNEYISVDDVVVQITETDRVAPPDLVSAAFSDTLTSVFVNFDRAVFHSARHTAVAMNDAPYGSEDMIFIVNVSPGLFDCHLIFYEEGFDPTIASDYSNSIFNGAECRWITRQRVEILLRTETSLFIGSVLRLYGADYVLNSNLGKTQANCRQSVHLKALPYSQLCAQGHITISPPTTTSTIANIVVSGSTSIPLCSGIALSVMKSTGHGGRLLETHWSVIPGTVTPALPDDWNASLDPAIEKANRASWLLGAFQDYASSIDCSNPEIDEEKTDCAVINAAQNSNSEGSYDLNVENGAILVRPRSYVAFVSVKSFIGSVDYHIFSITVEAGESLVLTTGLADTIRFTSESALHLEASVVAPCANLDIIDISFSWSDDAGYLSSAEGNTAKESSTLTSLLLPANEDRSKFFIPDNVYTISLAATYGAMSPTTLDFKVQMDFAPVNMDLFIESSSFVSTSSRAYYPPTASPVVPLKFDDPNDMLSELDDINVDMICLRINSDLEIGFAPTLSNQEVLDQIFALLSEDHTMACTMSDSTLVPFGFVSSRRQRQRRRRLESSTFNSTDAVFSHSGVPKSGASVGIPVKNLNEGDFLLMIMMEASCDGCALSPIFGRNSMFFSVTSSATPPSLQVSSTSDIPTPLKPIRVNPHCSLVLAARLYGESSESLALENNHEWTQHMGWLNMSQTDSSTNEHPAFALPLTNHQTLVKSGELKSGSEYVFRFTQDINGFANPSMEDLYIFVNSPPERGHFEVNPSVGRALSTEFNFRGFGWLDLDVRSGCMLQYGLRLESDGELPDFAPGSVDAIPLAGINIPFNTPNSLSSDWITMLPLGNPLDSWKAKATLIVATCDGAKTESEIEVISKPPLDLVNTDTTVTVSKLREHVPSIESLYKVKQYTEALVLTSSLLHFIQLHWQDLILEDGVDSVSYNQNICMDNDGLECGDQGFCLFDSLKRRYRCQCLDERSGRVCQLSPDDQTLLVDFKKELMVLFFDYLLPSSISLLDSPMLDSSLIDRELVISVLNLASSGGNVLDEPLKNAITDSIIVLSASDAQTQEIISEEIVLCNPYSADLVKEMQVLGSILDSGFDSLSGNTTLYDETDFLNDSTSLLSDHSVELADLMKQQMHDSIDWPVDKHPYLDSSLFQFNSTLVSSDSGEYDESEIHQRGLESGKITQSLVRLNKLMNLLLLQTHGVLSRQMFADDRQEGLEVFFSSKLTVYLQKRYKKDLFPAMLSPVPSSLSSSRRLEVDVGSSTSDISIQRSADYPSILLPVELEESVNINSTALSADGFSVAAFVFSENPTRNLISNSLSGNVKLESSKIVYISLFDIERQDSLVAADMLEPVVIDFPSVVGELDAEKYSNYTRECLRWDSNLLYWESNDNLKFIDSLSDAKNTYCEYDGIGSMFMSTLSNPIIRDVVYWTKSLRPENTTPQELVIIVSIVYLGFMLVANRKDNVDVTRKHTMKLWQLLSMKKLSLVDLTHKYRTPAEVARSRRIRLAIKASKKSEKLKRGDVESEDDIEDEIEDEDMIDGNLTVEGDKRLMLVVSSPAFRSWLKKRLPEFEKKGISRDPAKLIKLYNIQTDPSFAACVIQQCVRRRQAQVAYRKKQNKGKSWLRRSSMNFVGRIRRRSSIILEKMAELLINVPGKHSQDEEFRPPESTDLSEVPSEVQFATKQQVQINIAGDESVNSSYGQKRLPPLQQVRGGKNFISAPVLDGHVTLPMRRISEGAHMIHGNNPMPGDESKENPPFQPFGGNFANRNVKLPRKSYGNSLAEIRSILPFYNRGNDVKLVDDKQRRRLRQPPTLYQEETITGIQPFDDHEVIQHEHRHSFMKINASNNKSKLWIKLMLLVWNSIMFVMAILALACALDLFFSLELFCSLAVSNALWPLGFLFLFVSFALFSISLGAFHITLLELRLAGTFLLWIGCGLFVVILLLAHVSWRAGVSIGEEPLDDSMLDDWWPSLSSSAVESIQNDLGCCGWRSIGDTSVCPDEAFVEGREIVCRLPLHTSVAPVVRFTSKWAVWLSLGTFLPWMLFLGIFKTIKSIEEFEIQWMVKISPSLNFVRGLLDSLPIMQSFCIGVLCWFLADIVFGIGLFTHQTLVWPFAVNFIPPIIIVVIMLSISIYLVIRFRKLTHNLMQFAEDAVKHVKYEQILFGASGFTFLSAIVLLSTSILITSWGENLNEQAVENLRSALVVKKAAISNDVSLDGINTFGDSRYVVSDQVKDDLDLKKATGISFELNDIDFDSGLLNFMPSSESIADLDDKQLESLAAALESSYYTTDESNGANDHSSLLPDRPEDFVWSIWNKDLDPTDKIRVQQAYECCGFADSLSDDNSCFSENYKYTELSNETPVAPPNGCAVRIAQQYEHFAYRCSVFLVPMSIWLFITALFEFISIFVHKRRFELCEEELEVEKDPMAKIPAFKPKRIGPDVFLSGSRGWKTKAVISCSAIFSSVLVIKGTIMSAIALDVRFQWDWLIQKDLVSFLSYFAEISNFQWGLFLSGCLSVILGFFGLRLMSNHRNRRGLSLAGVLVLVLLVVDISTVGQMISLRRMTSLDSEDTSFGWNELSLNEKFRLQTRLGCCGFDFVDSDTKAIDAKHLSDWQLLVKSSIISQRLEDQMSGEGTLDGSSGASTDILKVSIEDTPIPALNWPLDGLIGGFFYPPVSILNDEKENMVHSQLLHLKAPTDPWKPIKQTEAMPLCPLSSTQRTSLTKQIADASTAPVSWLDDMGEVQFDNELLNTEKWFAPSLVSSLAINVDDTASSDKTLGDPIIAGCHSLLHNEVKDLTGNVQWLIGTCVLLETLLLICLVVVRQRQAIKFKVTSKFIVYKMLAIGINLSLMVIAAAWLAMHLDYLFGWSYFSFSEVQLLFDGSQTFWAALLLFCAVLVFFMGTYSAIFNSRSGILLQTILLPTLVIACFFVKVAIDNGIGNAEIGSDTFESLRFNYFSQDYSGLNKLHHSLGCCGFDEPSEQMLSFEVSLMSHPTLRNVDSYNGFAVENADSSEANIVTLKKSVWKFDTPTNSTYLCPAIPNNELVGCGALIHEDVKDSFWMLSYVFFGLLLCLPFQLSLNIGFLMELRFVSPKQWMHFIVRAKALSILYGMRFKENHSFFSCFVHFSNAFTRPQRVTVFFVCLLTLATATAYTLHEKCRWTSADVCLLNHLTNSDIYLAVLIASAIVVPVYSLINFLFSRLEVVRDRESWQERHVRQRQELMAPYDLRLINSGHNSLNDTKKNNKKRGRKRRESLFLTRSDVEAHRLDESKDNGIPVIDHSSLFNPSDRITGWQQLRSNCMRVVRGIYVLFGVSKLAVGIGCVLLIALTKNGIAHFIKESRMMLLSNYTWYLTLYLTIALVMLLFIAVIAIKYYFYRPSVSRHLLRISLVMTVVLAISSIYCFYFFDDLMSEESSQQLDPLSGFKDSVTLRSIAESVWKQQRESSDMSDYQDFFQCCGFDDSSHLIFQECKKTVSTGCADSLVSNIKYVWNHGLHRLFIGLSFGFTTYAVVILALLLGDLRFLETYRMYFAVFDDHVKRDETSSNKLKKANTQKDTSRSRSRRGPSVKAGQSSKIRRISIDAARLSMPNKSAPSLDNNNNNNGSSNNMNIPKLPGSVSNLDRSASNPQSNNPSRESSNVPLEALQDTNEVKTNIKHKEKSGLEADHSSPSLWLSLRLLLGTLNSVGVTKPVGDAEDMVFTGLFNIEPVPDLDPLEQQRRGDKRNNPGEIMKNASDLERKFQDHIKLLLAMDLRFRQHYHAESFNTLSKRVWERELFMRQLADEELKQQLKLKSKNKSFASEGKGASGGLSLAEEYKSRTMLLPWWGLMVLYGTVYCGCLLMISLMLQRAPDFDSDGNSIWINSNIMASLVFLMVVEPFCLLLWHIIVPECVDVIRQWLSGISPTSLSHMLATHLKNQTAIGGRPILDWFKPLELRRRSASISIQKVFRGYLARKRFETLLAEQRELLEENLALSLQRIELKRQELIYEVEYIQHEFTASQLQEAHELFQEADNSNKGYLDEVDIFLMMEGFGVSLSDQQLNQIFLDADILQNGKLEFNEFLLLIKRARILADIVGDEGESSDFMLNEAQRYQHKREQTLYTQNAPASGMETVTSFPRSPSPVKPVSRSPSPEPVSQYPQSQQVVDQEEKFNNLGAHPLLVQHMAPVFAPGSDTKDLQHNASRRNSMPLKGINVASLTKYNRDLRHSITQFLAESPSLHRIENLAQTGDSQKIEEQTKMFVRLKSKLAG